MLYSIYTFPLFVSTIIAILASDVMVVDDRSSLFLSRFFSFLYIYTTLVILLLNALMQINKIRLVGEFYEFDIYKISRIEFYQIETTRFNQNYFRENIKIVHFEKQTLLRRTRVL